MEIFHLDMETIRNHSNKYKAMSITNATMEGVHGALSVCNRKRKWVDTLLVFQTSILPVSHRITSMELEWDEPQPHLQWGPVASANQCLTFPR